MVWYNPIDDLKWVASKTSMGGGGTRAPGARFEYNPNSQNPAVRDGSMGPGGAPGLSAQTGQPDPWKIDDAMRKRLLAQQAGLAGRFADQGQANYGQLTQQGQGALAGLQAIANGQNSVSAEQLRQGLVQNQAAQMSMAAGASPQNAAMAARTAAIQAGRLGAGLAGQQAIAGLQERQQAQQQYAALLQALRGQDLQASLGGRQNAMGGYGAGAQGAPEKSWWEQNGPAIQAGLSAAAMMSDRRLKTDISDGSEVAAQALKGLGAHLYKYKDEQYGKGEQLGQMAQSLENTRGLQHTVIDTPQGKMVHGGKLAAALAAMMPGLDARLSKLEGTSK